MNSLDATAIKGEFIASVKVAQIEGNKSVDAIVTKVASESFKSRVEYQLYIDNKKSGYVRLDHFSLREDDVFGSDVSDSHTRYYGYNYYREPLDSNENSEVKNKSYIYMEYIHNLEPKKYKGIGSLLFQVAVEHSITLGCEGRIRLQAVRDTPVFHYKQGMRTEHTVLKTGVIISGDSMDREILQALNDQKAGKPRQNLGLTNMYLPEENIQKWKAKPLAILACPTNGSAEKTT